MNDNHDTATTSTIPTESRALCGDALGLLPSLATNSIDAVVIDPP